ncbi:hypothetical protein BKA62DRAFT_720989 [Auriculariales sp. MPI-PUGE-AT-0066]|nr:hypothetical protein BKA62DRAFT_720989 [Auriculariales sp. MPI-PUGE-AT-0066]
MATLARETSWDEHVRSTTSSYVYDDTTVWLSVAERRYKISRKRLTDVSPVFKDMFELPPMNDDPIDLPVNLIEFEHFLWYLHVDHLEFSKWDGESTGEARFSRVLGIATIAHVYQAGDIVTWAVAQILGLLPALPVRDIVVVKRLYEFSLRADGVDPQLPKQSRDYWCSRVIETSDPVEWLLAAKELDDQYLQAYAYFHILKCTGVKVASDTRLTVLDRVRLLLGVTNLRRFCPVMADVNSSCPCQDPWTHYQYGHSHSWRRIQPEPPVTGDQSELTIMADVPFQETYGTLTLWEVFTRSVVGFQATDGVDTLIVAPQK